MVSNNHYIELYINKEAIELESQESLNLRINNVLFNPTKTTTTQAEYSFTFDIPSTPNNDKVLDYANNLSKTNKFHTRYKAELYADGNLLFDGSLTIQKYNTKSKMYSCNLVNIKVNTIDEIFGEMTLTDLKWEVPFSGASTINSVNNDLSTKYFFPYVSYGVFQKVPYESDEVGNEYTSKFEIDKYNRSWVETFYPSLNMMEMVKRAYESKGYAVGGSAYSDQNISNIFASCNLANEQVPIYNLGNPLFGEVDISASYSSVGSGYQQELDYPYFQVSTVGYSSGSLTSDTKYNFPSIDIYRPLGSGGTVTINKPTYMYDPEEMVVVIPADGWYRIELSASTTLNTSGSITAAQYLVDFVDRELYYDDVNLNVGLDEITPVEIQIVRNYNDNIELIKGKHNKKYANGNPNDTQYEKGGIVYNNITNWLTCCPHEDPYNAINPTEKNDLTFKNSKSNLGGKRTSDSNSFGASDPNGNYSSGNEETSASGNFSGRRGGSRSIGGSERNPSGRDRKYSYLNLGYIYQDEILGDGAQGSSMAFDQAVSEGFICGMSSLSSGITSVMKNGYSWSKSNSTLNESFYDSLNYDHIYRESGTGEVIQEHISGMTFNKNEYINAPINRCKVNGNTMNGFVSCMVWLNRNDVIEPVIIHRSYEYENGNPVTYQTTTNLRFKIQAFSTAARQVIKADHKNIYYENGVTDPDLKTEFPVNLNLFNFTNRETKVSDWISNITKAYNLEITSDENTVDIDINRGIKKTITNAIDVDDRVGFDEAQAEYISYPREMSVRYKVDKEEYGFECTVPQDHINDEDWYNYGDSGYTVIQLNDDTYETSTQNTQTNFSYTWYCPFTWKQVNYDSTSGYVETGTEKMIRIPVIEKSEYMADGYGYYDAMQHDGYSFAQRFWFRQAPSSEYVVLADHQHEQVYLTYPINSYDGFHLSYKDTEKSIVSEYFNVAPMLSSNYVKIDVNITPEEYQQIKGGALIHYDNDLYYTSEISGYDPTGGNSTTLKLIKKV